MKGVIIYKSQYGSTKEYAEWLGEDLGFEVFSYKEDCKEKLKEAKVVVIGSWVMASMPTLARWVKKNWSKLEGKKVVMYTTSGSPADNPELQEGFKKSMGELADKVKYFPIGGRMVFDKLNWFHRFGIKMAIKMTKDSKKKEEMGKDVDNVSRENLGEIIEYIKQ